MLQSSAQSYSIFNSETQTSIKVATYDSSLRNQNPFDFSPLYPSDYNEDSEAQTTGLRPLTLDNLMRFSALRQNLCFEYDGSNTVLTTQIMCLAKESSTVGKAELFFMQLPDLQNAQKTGLIFNETDTNWLKSLQVERWREDLAIACGYTENRASIKCEYGNFTNGAWYSDYTIPWSGAVTIGANEIYKDAKDSIFISSE